MLGVALSSSAPLLAQEPPATATTTATATVIGVITDASTRSPVLAADVSLVNSGRRTASDAGGRFLLRTVPVGPEVLRISRLGYRDQDVAVTVTESMPVIEILLEPSPLELDGLTVAGGGRGDLTGIILDGDTGDRIPWANLELRRNVTERVGRPFGADDAGGFRASNIQTGLYLLLVKRLGYRSVFIPVSHSVPATPIVVSLEPDPDLMRGIEAVQRRIGTQVKAHPHSSRSISEERLRQSKLTNLCDFIRFESNVGIGVVDDGLGISDCSAYAISEIYQINVLECRGGGRTGSRTYYYTYTNEYVEQQALRPREPIPLICGVTERRSPPPLPPPPPRRPPLR